MLEPRSFDMKLKIDTSERNLAPLDHKTAELEPDVGQFLEPLTFSGIQSTRLSSDGLFSPTLRFHTGLILSNLAVRFHNLKWQPPSMETDSTRQTRENLLGRFENLVKAFKSGETY